MMKHSVKRIHDKNKHRVADYDPDTRTIWIKRNACFTAIRILPDGRLEVDGKIVA